MLPQSSRPAVPFSRRVTAAFFALAGVYSLVVATFLLLRKRSSDRQPFIGLFNVFAHLLMLPALPLMLLALAFRRRWLALIQIIPISVFAASYGKRFVPKPSPIVTSPELRVMTYNIHKYAGQYIDSVIAVIREADADIVAMQELSFEAAEALCRELADLYPHQAMHPMKYAWRGQGILSRYPITADEFWRNKQFSFSLGHQRAEINVNGVSVTVYNTHPAHPNMSGAFYSGKAHRQETDIVLGRAAQDKTPILIVGDFNMSDQSDDYRLIASRYPDSYQEAGWGMGFSFPDLIQPSDLPSFIPRTRLFPPLIRLDYIFHSNDFRAVEAKVWPTSGGSDHRPVVVRLMFNEQKMGIA